MKNKNCISGIYKITNIINNKCYIGSAVNIRNRWYMHKHALQNNLANRRLQGAWNKYGEECFKFEVICACKKEDLLIYEQKWIDFYDSAGRNGYNITPTAGSSIGVIRSEEYKKRMSLIKTGFKHSEQAKLKIGMASKGNTNTKGIKWTEEQCKHLSEIRKGHIGWTKGYHQSEESNRKRSESLKGRNRSEETKRKISETRLRKKIKHSMETRRKLSRITKKQWEMGQFKKIA